MASTKTKFLSLTIYDIHALFLDPLAFAYNKSGDLKRAREEYEKITLLTAGRFYYGDIYARSFYPLVKIPEEEGDLTKAIDYYSKFLDLWKDTDPDIHEIEDAKKRLTELL
ncbi:MAG: hypothetical protein ACETWK_00010 [Candidatus Aminicenantaceae bacterium]